ncbi:hypothetical protein FF86_10705 [Frankia sp. CpI1-P]|nr:hypothetical protein FF86_10705 [Frankia sp. CpI1-P]
MLAGRVAGRSHAKSPDAVAYFRHHTSQLPYGWRLLVRVSKTDEICGMPAPTARELMRAIAHDSVDDDYIASWLDVAASAATRIRESLVAEGYLECSSEDERDSLHVTTIKGNALAQASFSPQIHRRTAEKNISGMLERVREYNRDNTKILAISRIQIFGSFLDSSSDRIGDIDLAVTILRRPDKDSYIKALYAYCNASGRRFGTHLDFLDWPRVEAIRTVKGRSPAINVTNEDITRFTDRWRDIYMIDKDEQAIQPPKDAPAEL